ncbi:MAG: gamma-glutamylcyclotransferase family protein [Rhodospirillales bacterium]
MARYFFYGTLMDPAVRSAVLGRDLPTDAITPAALFGWRRVFRAGATFPVLVPAASSRVDGIAADGLSAAECERLAHFEGPDYRLRRVTLILRPGGQAAAYAFLPAKPMIAAGRTWNFATWRRRHRRAFLEHIGKYGTAV